MRRREITIVRHVTALVRITREGQERHKYLELAPGDVLGVLGKDDNTFHLSLKAKLDLPEHSWVWIKPGVTSVEFVEAWQRAPGIAEVAAALDKPIRKILAWERRCRREGAVLKRLRTV
jgi:hypothetical protein